MNQPLYERCVKPAGKVLARTHIAVHRLTRGRLGRHWDGGDVAFITTTGRRTGRRHTIPLACIRHASGIAVVASNGGSCCPPDWWLKRFRSHPARRRTRGDSRRLRGKCSLSRLRAADGVGRHARHDLDLVRTSVDSAPRVCQSHDQSNRTTYRFARAQPCRARSRPLPVPRSVGPGLSTIGTASGTMRAIQSN
jgi:F420H(2)-dependent quinone reductase